LALLAWFLALIRASYKNYHVDYTVEALCNLLAKHKLLDSAEVRTLRQRWLSEAKDAAADADKFGKWLVAGGHLTEFQLGVLSRGAVEQLFFDQYLLQDRIGQGRMAGVYRAVHPTGQQVAIKVLPPSKAANPMLLARFQREARISLPLDHPQVVRTFQQGKTKAGLNYIVMEYLDGESLEDVLKRRKTLLPVEAVHVGVQTLEGLQYLFEEGLVHRDIKPANLILIPGREPGRPDTTLSSTVKILDIGLGRSLFDESTAGLPDNVDLTTEGAILGTPNYMAPEQARSAHGADIRADIYSLGCVLYEALCGEAPFADPNFMKQVLRHATEPPRPLPQLKPDVPEYLWQVIETMLAKDPAQRFSTARQAAKALRNSVPAPVEVPKPAEPTPKMRSYLTWLATSAPTPDADAPAAAPPTPPTPVAKPAASPAPAPPPAKPAAVAPPVPRPVEAAPALAPKALGDATPVLPTPVAAAAPAPLLPPVAVAAPAPLPARAPTPAPPTAANTTPLAQMRPQPPKSSPVVPVAAPWPPTPSVASSPHAHPASPEAAPLFHIGGVAIRGRDLVCAGAGAGALLVLEGLLWLILRLFGG
jgi:serine/threonine protein kinase